MSQAARLFHICRRLSLGQKVTSQSLQDELEVSRATIFRDIAVLRDQLQAPIEWDSDAESYRLEVTQDVASRFVVPHMHMTAREVYGLLTVVNVASALDPGVATDFSLAMPSSRQSLTITLPSGPHVSVSSSSDVYTAMAFCTLLNSSL